MLGVDVGVEPVGLAQRVLVPGAVDVERPLALCGLGLEALGLGPGPFGVGRLLAGGGLALRVVRDVCRGLLAESGGLFALRSRLRF